MGFDNEEELGVGVVKCEYSDFMEELTGTVEALMNCDDPKFQALMKKRNVKKSDILYPKLVLGRPGVGKTAGITALAKKMSEKYKEKLKGKSFGFKKIMLGQLVVGELNGIPVINVNDGTMTRALTDDLPNIERDGEYGILFLDEITTVDDAQVMPGLSLADGSRSIGSIYYLPENWLVVGAGNGPDCSNFLRLSEPMISRFAVYDIIPNFKHDFLEFAMQEKIDPLIIAYLTFRPEELSKTVTTEADKCARQFPCPRTWYALSKNLDLREMQGRPVGDTEMFKFASSYIGIDSAKDFQAFRLFRTKINYDINKIIDGTESMPKKEMDEQAFLILINSLVDSLLSEMKDTVDDEGAYPEEVYRKVGNVMRWTLYLEKQMLDKVFVALINIMGASKELSSILIDPDFSPFCPEFDNFITTHHDLISQNIDLGSL